MSPDFSRYLSAFLGKYLPDMKGSSPNTISSYSDTFRLLLDFCQNWDGIHPEKMEVRDITCDRITRFLDWIETERNCGVSTRNQRFAGICSFLRYVQIYTPVCTAEIQKILAIPSKRNETAEIHSLSFEDMKRILNQPDSTRRDGRRDRIMMCLLYDTGARVSELIDLEVRDIRLAAPPRVILHGKGRKQRSVPLMNDTRDCLSQYMQEHRLLAADRQMDRLFANRQGEKFTRAGVTYIINKYVKMVRLQNTRISEKVSPHVFRHSKAMHLLQAGVNIIYIKDILGHVDVTTTQLYLKADMEMKKEALEKVKIEILPRPEVPPWASDRDLIEWLTELGKKAGI